MAVVDKSISLSLKGGGTCFAFEDPLLKNLTWVEAVLPFSECSKLERGNANVRPPAMKRPFKAMEYTVENHPEQFHVLNRGIFYVCGGVKYDGKEKITVQPKRGRGEPWGIGDGGHTFDVVCKEVQRAKELAQEINWKEPYVRVTFASWDDPKLPVSRVVEARNTSLQVQAYSIEDYKGSFDSIKEALEAAKFDKGLVAYRENVAKPWHITEIIQRMGCCLPERWRNKHPTSFVTSKNRAVKEYLNAESHSEFERLFPVIKDIITLPERLASMISAGDLVNVRKLESVPSTTNPVAKRMRRESWSRPGTNFSVKHKIDVAALLPMASAFRELLVKDKNGNYKWGMPLDKAVKDCLPDMYEKLVEQAKRAPVPSALGYDPAYWAGCQNVTVRYLKA
jgi:hypothetical protein